MAAAAGTPDMKTLAAEIATIKDKLPDQSHAMADVSYHFGNLWFAGQQENWPLANFYSSETRSHLHWAVRIIPESQGPGRQGDRLANHLAVVGGQPTQAGAGRDQRERQASLRASLSLHARRLHACHKAADKPYIRPQIPTRPETPIVNFDPKADWPK